MGCFDTHRSLVRFIRFADRPKRHIDIEGRYAAKLSSLKRFVVRRINSDEIGNTAGQDVAENSEAGAENGFRFELPRNRHPRIKLISGRDRGSDGLLAASAARLRQDGGG